MNREEIAGLIVDRLIGNRHKTARQFEASRPSIGYFYIDDLLPKEIALECHNKFPTRSEMRELNTIREHKSVSAQMNMHAPILEEVLYAFQDPEVVSLIGEVCGIENLLPDESLYAGGLSSMGKNQFLNPHLDNSHDNEMNLWRTLNLLYYVTPDWELENGGNLEVWPDGVQGEPTTIVSKFNRLAVMATHGGSWHSVSKVKTDHERRCISNYYFSKEPLREDDKQHVTLYKGRPEEIVKKVLLEADGLLRTGIRKVFKKGIKKNPHIYKKEE